MAKRADGHYWVSRDGETSDVAKHVDGRWYIDGGLALPSDFDWIDEEPIPPKKPPKREET